MTGGDRPVSAAVEFLPPLLLFILSSFPAPSLSLGGAAATGGVWHRGLVVGSARTRGLGFPGLQRGLTVGLAAGVIVISMAGMR